VTPADREQPWRDDETERGRVVLLTDNPISRAIATIAGTVGHEVVVIADDDGGPRLGSLALRAGRRGRGVRPRRPRRPAVLRDALASDASYVAMMASRRRAEGLLADLGAEGVPGWTSCTYLRATTSAARDRARSPCPSSPRSWPRPMAAPVAPCEVLGVS
jgi:xanthine dehydrogenase accessory factor